jgi:hypothetical protein
VRQKALRMRHGKLQAQVQGIKAAEEKHQDIKVKPHNPGLSFFLLLAQVCYRK